VSSRLIPARGRRLKSLGADADYAQQAATGWAFFAVAEEAISIARGAELRDEDVFFADAGFEELGAVCFLQVEEDLVGRRLMAGGHHVEPLERVRLVAGAEFVEEVGGVGKFCGEGGGDFGAYFVAAATDGRADRG
jgi:hypothetical protein